MKRLFVVPLALATSLLTAAPAFAIDPTLGNGVKIKLDCGTSSGCACLRQELLGDTYEIC